MKNSILLFCLLFFSAQLFSQSTNPIINNIIDEATSNSQLEELAHQMLDEIGPRLVGTPQMKQAHDWAVETFEGWNISARNEKWGEWKSWERGITHIDMVSPRVQSLRGMQLAWSPSTKKDGFTAEAMILPTVTDSLGFAKWLPNVKGKLVLVDMMQPTGRPDENWEEFAKEGSFEKMKKDRDSLSTLFNENIERTGYNRRSIHAALEAAGAAGIITSNWSRGFGVNKIFSARTNKIPTVDLELEDYGLVYRLASSGKKPMLHITAISKDLGTAPTFNTIAEIKGTEKPDEYVILSAHFDSWDGATGATDNGTGSLIMMEAARILKKYYPNPKRTILVGLWGSEEQGLNGSRAFVEDHPNIVANTQALFNQDNGTGRVVRLSGGGFLHAYDYLTKWLQPVPDHIANEIETTFPGAPARGGSDYASFQAAGAPGFSLSSLSWDYWNYTWHTNRDTYDKIVFDDLRDNVILTAILTYMASEDPETTSRVKAVLPVDRRTGEPREWPTPRSPNRNGG